MEAASSHAGETILVLLAIIAIVVVISIVVILLKKKPSNEQIEHLCPQCGKPVKHGKNFCTGCGAKIE